MIFYDTCTETLIISCNYKVICNYNHRNILTHIDWVQLSSFLLYIYVLFFIASYIATEYELIYTINGLSVNNYVTIPDNPLICTQ